MKTYSLPVISIIMPAYNSSKYIIESIESVLQQTFSNWELLIVNDGSTDNTAEIVRKFVDLDERIKLFNKPNGGIASSRNYGFANAKGDFIAYLDHDDLWTSEKLALQVEAFSMRNEVDVIFGNGIVFYSNAIQESYRYDTITGFYTHRELYLKQIRANYIPILSLLVRRKVLEAIGPWDESEIYQGCDDYDYWFRMARANANFLGLDSELFKYRKHDNNYSNNTRKMLAAEANVLIKNFDAKYLSKNKDLKFFKYRVHSLVLSLVQLEELNEANEILKRLKIVPSVLLMPALKVISIFSKNSVPTLRVLLKLDRVFTF